MTFEKDIEEIEKIASKMDDGKGLDETVELFKKGMELAAKCREYLEKTEMLVESLDGSRLAN
jgi:exodeoxyribonuclease VII small subunit